MLRAFPPGDAAYGTIPELGYKATVRVADVITQSQSDSTTRTVRLDIPGLAQAVRRSSFEQNRFISCKRLRLRSPQTLAAYLAGLTSGVFSGDEDFPATAAGGLKVTGGRAAAGCTPAASPATPSPSGRPTP